jgi:hypothetical protein
MATILVLAAAASEDADTTLVRQHVAGLANATFRQPSGVLKYPYLVPAGPYDEMWDWDAFFMGVALDEYGSRPYLAGTMKNFLDHTNVTTGEVQGCIKPSGSTGSIYHAKPVVIQGAWLSCKSDATAAAEFARFEPQMKALLAYWEQPPRRHVLDGGDALYVWHDQMQTGADNLVTSACPSKYSFWCWNEAKDADALASVDLPVFLTREHRAFAHFQRAWARAAPAAEASRRVRLAAAHEATS